MSTREAVALAKFTPDATRGGSRQWLHEDGRLYIQMTTSPRGLRSYEICDRERPNMPRWFVRSLGDGAVKIERYLNDATRDALAKSAGLRSGVTETAYGVFP